MVFSCGGMIMGLHALITRVFPTTHSNEMDEQLLAEQLKQTRSSKAGLLAKPTAGGQTSEVGVEEEPVKKDKLSLREVVVFLAKSPHMRCAVPCMHLSRRSSRSPRSMQSQRPLFGQSRRTVLRSGEGCR